MDKEKILSNLEEAKRYLQKRCAEFPKFVVVLGSGLSGLLQDLKVEIEIPYSEIPHFRMATAQGHVSRLLIGDLKGTRVACMQGRLHYYEGYGMSEVVFPFRLFALLGAEVFFLTNAAGGLHPEMKPLDLLLLRDHVNLMGTNPLIGPNLAEFGPRFPDMTDVYHKQFSDQIAECAKRLNIKLREGVYIGLHGPSYETPAEIQMYRKLGGDVVGMSTVPEAIALRHMGKSVVAISCVTNLAAGVSPTPLNHDEVLENAKKIHVTFANLVTESLREMKKSYDTRATPSKAH